jgi:hypothetical protein
VEEERRGGRSGYAVAAARESGSGGVARARIGGFRLIPCRRTSMGCAIAMH